MRSDNGGEYTSGKFADFLKSEGVRHELTVPKTPQQNSVAERCNRTLVEMTRAMISGSNLPQRLWAETMSTAVYLKNRSPTKPVKGKTPFEVLNGKKPKVEHLRILGCASYAHIPKDQRKKLDVTAVRCVLIGYGTEVKGYRLYNPSSGKVFFSRDVKFNEDQIGIEKEIHSVESDTQKFVELEISDDVVEANIPDADVGLVPSRRSTRVRKRPDYLAESASIVTRNIEEPRIFQEAATSLHKTKWEKAMEEEMKSLQDNNVWKLVDPPVDRKIIGSKWVYKVKRDGDGRLERYKARLVAQGYTQQKGADYDETFSPVVRMESLRTDLLHEMV